MVIPLKPPSVTSTLPCLTTSNLSLRPQSLTSLPWRRNILSYPLVSSFCLVQKSPISLNNAHVFALTLIGHTHRYYFCFSYKAQITAQSWNGFCYLSKDYFSIQKICMVVLFSCCLKLFSYIFCKRSTGSYL